jgi:hypothetical protein
MLNVGLCRMHLGAFDLWRVLLAIASVSTRLSSGIVRVVTGCEEKKATDRLA